MIFDTYKQIEDITSKLIGVSLSVEQNYPSERDGIIYISDKVDTSRALKNIPYKEIYESLDEEKNYNIKMIDGALIQFMYTFDDKKLLKYKLAFFPSPNLDEFQNNSDVYEMDEIYADIIDKNIIATPIRFDYDPHPDSHIPVSHPISHLTIGQYKNCRIPVIAPITPYIFIDFILRNFYNTAHIKYSDELDFDKSLMLENSIDPTELKILHLAIN